MLNVEGDTPKRKMIFREFVEFRKKFGDDAIKMLVNRNRNI